MITVCDLADDLRDAIVEYQVSVNPEKQLQDSSFTQFAGCTTKGNLQAEL